MSRRNFRVLVTPLSSHGHINACHGLCEELRDRGHEVTFVLDKTFAGKLINFGFKEYILESPPPLLKNYPEFDENKDFWPQFIAKNAQRYTQPPLEQVCDVTQEEWEYMFEYQNQFTEQYQKAIAQLKPDLIVHDGYIAFPVILNSSIPWIWLYSASPAGMFTDGRIPPGRSGLPIDADPKEWKKFSEIHAKAMAPFQKKVNQYNLDHGGADLNGRLHPFSNFLNVFMQPKELRYAELGDLPENIVAVDCFVRTLPPQKPFQLPKQLCDKPGKLIFFSLGSFGCGNLAVMTRLLAILAMSPNKFIVSKGPLKYDLPGDNLWGEPFLPQTTILPLVDLVITHGGNNTVTETFYYGKPMLVLPLCGDQFDNGQRISECGLGARLNTNAQKKNCYGQLRI